MAGTPPTTTSVVVWEKEFNEKITIGLVITLKGCVRILWEHNQYAVELQTPQFRHKWPLPDAGDVFRCSIPVSIPLVSNIDMRLHIERRDMNDPDAGYRITLVAEALGYDVQILAVAVRFGKVMDHPDLQRTLDANQSVLNSGGVKCPAFYAMEVPITQTDRSLIDNLVTSGNRRVALR